MNAGQPYVRGEDITIDLPDFDVDNLPESCPLCGHEWRNKAPYCMTCGYPYECPLCVPDDVRVLPDRHHQH